ncbi:hypothetical protein TNCT_166161 [Trichonephila clavata]|uniref:Uncharacterized protein n=1 Tax=Trichonephila clavata TaxID=2740835 RepID=A0A8X6GDU4_TRICU|nr:hypothetical protein TNCT_166161 [Trichonephila clavata]
MTNTSLTANALAVQLEMFATLIDVLNRTALNTIELLHQSHSCSVHIRYGSSAQATGRHRGRTDCSQPPIKSLWRNCTENFKLLLYSSETFRINIVFAAPQRWLSA